MPTVPDALLEPLTVTTDAKGVATLTYLPGIMVPLSIRVAGPGVAPHTLPLDVPQGRNVCPQAGPLRASGRNRPYGIRRAAGRCPGGTLGPGAGRLLDRLRRSAR